MVFTPALFALLAGVAIVRADPTPSEPGPGSVYNEGSNCFVSWEADTTGVWKVMNIELMAGDNFDMQYLTTVATVDGTDSDNNSFTYPCPAVSPHSPVYFYQFTSPYSTAIYWTTRFAIADASGATTAPAESTQPGGSAIPWGTAALDNPADAQPSPAFGESTAGATATAVASAPASASPTFSAASVPSGWSLVSTPSVSSVPPTSVAGPGATEVVPATNGAAPAAGTQSAPNSLQTVRGSATPSTGAVGASPGVASGSNANTTTANAGANGALSTLAITFAIAL
ncbi:hypothetical protein CERSUDRAFT_112683 [Gelatoporia subvermispora B]|uniref:Yeast cell wall synthesis Kre9/Knh1-like N-terminal domain-containing protein n=1 Tax=Ceriporiopsis subvermispora (strain B) TaxID=914234 RepID=M2PQW7_CERS8|nr:hypothetical protein CERSUDRAFT_112683 [Gelatoporia subvermispora B]